MVLLYVRARFERKPASFIKRAKQDGRRLLRNGLFGLLPHDQAEEIAALWREFEARQTMEARFAAALDRLMPLLLNYHTEGQSWLEHGVTRGQVVERNQHIDAASPQLWAYARALIDDAVAKGYLKP